MSSYNFQNAVKDLGGDFNVPYSKAWYVHFSMLRRLRSVMGNEDDFLDDPALFEDPEWLLLPFERRKIAEHRFNVIRNYDRLDKPSDQDAEIAAQQLGVTTGQFYRLRRSWRQNYDIFKLLPFGRPGFPRKPKLDEEVSTAVRELVRTAINSEGMQAPKDILHYVQTNWTLDKPVPSHMTIRKRIALALESLKAGIGRIDVVRTGIPFDALESASKFGEVIVVDHIGLKVFVASDGGPISPIATFAIDLFTRSICGVHLSFGFPGARQVADVLRDAAERSGKKGTKKSAIKPRLTFETGMSLGWKKLVAQLEKSPHDAIITSFGKLKFGDAVTSLIGPKLGQINFISQKKLNETTFEPTSDALISFDELKILVERSVKDLNSDRLRDIRKLPRLEFDFLEIKIPLSHII